MGVSIRTLGWGLALCVTACGPAAGDPEHGGTGDETTTSTTADPTSGAGTGSGGTTAASGSATTSSTTAPATSSMDGSTGLPEDGEEGWLESGWGLGQFNAFEDGGAFPIFLGPQGGYMFVLQLRGGGFVIPPANSAPDHPHIARLTFWYDIDGFADGPDGHFATQTDAPMNFVTLTAPTGEKTHAAEQWIILGDTQDPEALVGREATLHLELSTADGEFFVHDHRLVVGEIL